MIKKELLEILACPKCKKNVREQEAYIVCDTCKVRYPVRNNIPIMLIEEAESV